MNPLLLVRFLAVADRLSFSEAVTDLSIDQGNLSRQIRQLEREPGFALFSRTTRSVALTLQGEPYFQRHSILLRWRNTHDAALRKSSARTKPCFASACPPSSIGRST